MSDEKYGWRKIDGQVEAEQLRRRDRHVGIAREIAIDLDGIEHGRGHDRGAVIIGRMAEHGIDIGRQIVRDAGLLDEAEEELDQRGADRDGIEPPQAVELRQEIISAHDRPGDQLREEAHEGRIVEQVAPRMHMPAIDVQRVAQALEGIEADTDRQDQPQRHRIGLDACGMQQGHEGIGEEIEVFEGEQQRQVHEQADHDDQLAPVRVRRRLHRQPGAVIEHGREGEQQGEARIPGAVEDVAGDQQHDLAVAVARERPIEREDDREEDEEARLDEQHRLNPPGSRRRSAR